MLWPTYLLALHIQMGRVIFCRGMEEERGKEEVRGKEEERREGGEGFSGGGENCCSWLLGAVARVGN